MLHGLHDESAKPPPNLRAAPVTSIVLPFPPRVNAVPSIEKEPEVWPLSPLQRSESPRRDKVCAQDSLKSLGTKIVWINMSENVKYSPHPLRL